MLAEIDGFTNQDLCDRYSIHRSTLNKQINGLKNLGYDFTSTVESGKVLYSLVQVKTLDSLQDYLKRSGNKIANFPRIDTPVDSLTRLSHATRDTPASSTLAVSPKERAPFQPSLIELVQAIAQSLAPSDPFAHLAALERASAHHWQPSTSELRALVGVIPRGKSFSRYGFYFVRAGKNGREAAWLIGKEDS